MINGYLKGGKLVPHFLYYFLSLIPVLGRVFANHPFDCCAFFIAVKLSGSTKNDDAGIHDGEPRRIDLGVIDNTERHFWVGNKRINFMSFFQAVNVYLSFVINETERNGIGIPIFPMTARTPFFALWRMGRIASWLICCLLLVISLNMASPGRKFVVFEVHIYILPARHTYFVPDSLATCRHC